MLSVHCAKGAQYAWHLPFIMYCILLGIMLLVVSAAVQRSVKVPQPCLVIARQPAECVPRCFGEAVFFSFDGDYVPCFGCW